MKASEAIRSSGNHSTFVVETLDHSIGDLAFGLEPVEKQGFMVAKSAGELLHGLDSGTQGLGGPMVEKVFCPGGMTISPEAIKIFLKDVSADGGQIAKKKLVEGFPSFSAHSLKATEKEPSSFSQPRGFSLQAHPSRFHAASLIDGFVELSGDMERIQNVECLGQKLGDGFEEGLPHVGANKTDGREDVGSHFHKELFQTALSSGFADPQQASTAAINLINQGKKSLGAFAFAPVEFIDTDGHDPEKIAMSQSPFHDVFYRSTDALPTRSKDHGNFLPRQPSSPASQKLHEGQRHLPFATSPWHPLGDHSMFMAVNPTWGIDENDRNHPERNKFKMPFRGMIVARSLTPTFTATSQTLGMSFNPDFNLRTAKRFFFPTNIVVNEILDGMNSIEYAFDCQLHGWLELGLFESQHDSGQPFFFHQSSYQVFLPPPPPGQKYLTGQCRHSKAGGLCKRRDSTLLEKGSGMARLLREGEDSPQKKLHFYPQI